ncbi:MAG TPA: RNA polymerase sigma factor [Planctomycetota bacterium]|nr:RNA polymerase sigma factor [Planctomycetota bacterium]
MKRELDEKNKALMERLKAGDESALSELMDVNDARVRRRIKKKLPAANAHDVDDVHNQVWYRVYKNAKLYTPGQATFMAWLYRIVRDECAQKLRKDGRRVQGAHYDEEAFEVGDKRRETPARAVQDEDMRREAMKAVNELSPEERAALENRLQGRSDADLADETGENRRTIAARYDRAIKWLKDRFKKEAS